MSTEGKRYWQMARELAVNRSSSWIFSAAIAILFIVLVVLIYPPIYAVNDNIAIMEGARDGFPVEFVATAFSWLLYGLYRIAPSVPWYASCLLIINAASLTAALYAFRRIFPSFTLGLLFTSVYLLFYSRFLFFLDYNATSIMAASHSLLLYLVLVRDNRTTTLSALTAGILLACSFMTRVYGLFAAVLFTVPFLLFGGYRSRNAIRARHLILFLAPLVLVWSSDVLLKGPLASPEYQRYRPIVLLQGKLLGYGKEKYVTDDILRKIDWTKTDLMRYSAWMYLDERIYSKDRFQELLSGISQAKRNDPNRLDGIKKKIRSLRRTYRLFFMLYAGVFLLVLTESRTKWKDVTLAVACTGYVFGGALAMAILYRFPERIGYPLLLMSSCFTLFLFHSFGTSRSPGRTGGRMFGFILILCALLFAGSPFAKKSVKEYRYYVQKGKAFETILHHINTEHPGSVVIYNPGLNLKYMLFVFSRHPERYRTVDLGWPIHSPRFYAQLRALGITYGYELLPRLIDRQDHFILSLGTGDIFMDLAVDYLRKHGYPSAKAVPIELIDANNVLYRIISGTS